ncbi:hypothetical protein [Legionella cincinnatiensis]|uniref:Uncharacterized protein n=1 Tax=Legionella cincinnatiensis TaxID=28085 RepID=A0A378IPC1_9GAMM|nr:hypothetical protein [Legionella cincinnatiensis]KTC92339.1 hypothetical protein Lcin_1118 [Legionella cincinnatiensis]STX36780.1 Uncharacterised protein [Legionella cincinnatiensis]
MIKNDIIEKNLESGDKNDLRYLFYLSSHNAWVNVAGDLFKLKITNSVETIENQVGSMIYFNKEYRPVTEQAELKLKTLISKNAIEAFVCGVSSDRAQLDATENKELRGLSLKSIQKVFTNIHFNLESHRTIELSIELYNFDNEFVHQLNALTSTEEKKHLISEYKNRFIAAQEDALANAFWKAAASGDYEQLLLLFNELNDFNINRSYEGRSIIEAMFAANPKIDLPFKSRQPDYKKTVELLLSHGLEKQIIDSASQKYQTIQNNLWFFQRENPVHKNMLLLLNQADDVNELDNEHVFEVINCVIQ